VKKDEQEPRSSVSRYCWRVKRRKPAVVFWLSLPLFASWFRCAQGTTGNARYLGRAFGQSGCVRRWRALPAAKETISVSVSFSKTGMGAMITSAETEHIKDRQGAMVGRSKSNMADGRVCCGGKGREYTCYTTIQVRGLRSEWEMPRYPFAVNPWLNLLCAAG
jgi:hypothetical protein